MTKDNATPLNGDDIWQHALSTARLGVIDRNFVTGDCSHSASWKRMLGYAEHELPDHGDLWLSLMHPEDVDLVKDVSRRNVIGEIPFLEAEFRLLSQVTVEARLTGLFWRPHPGYSRQGLSE